MSFSPTVSSNPLVKAQVWCCAYLEVCLCIIAFLLWCCFPGLVPWRVVRLGKWSKLSLLRGVGMEIGPYRVGALPCHATLGWVCSTTRVLSSTGVWSLQPYLAKLILLLGTGMKVGPYTVGPSFKSCDLGKGSFYNLYCWFPVSFLWCQS